MYHVHYDEKNQNEDMSEFQGFRYVGQEKLVTKPGHDNIVFGMGK
jgi:hypothetical protein